VRSALNLICPAECTARMTAALPSRLFAPNGVPYTAPTPRQITTSPSPRPVSPPIFPWILHPADFTAPAEVPLVKPLPPPLSDDGSATALAALSPPANEAEPVRSTIPATKQIVRISILPSKRLAIGRHAAAHDARSARPVIRGFARGQEKKREDFVAGRL